MLVCPLQGTEGVQGRECFLRVTSAHLFEVGLQAAQTLERLELQSLVSAELQSETESQREPGSEVSCGVRCLGRGSWLSRVVFENLLALVCQALGSVFPILSHEKLVPGRGAGCVQGCRV